MRDSSRYRRWGRRELDRLLVRDEVFRAGDPAVTSVLYAFCFPSHPGLLKIGFSKRGAVPRVMEQTTGYPERAVLRMVIHAPNASELEKAVHVALRARRASAGGREWFRASVADVIEACPELRETIAHEDLRVRIGRRREAEAVIADYAKELETYLQALAYRAWSRAAQSEINRIDRERSSWRVWLSSLLSGPRGEGSWTANIEAARRNFGDPGHYRRVLGLGAEMPILGRDFLTWDEALIEKRLRAALTSVAEQRVAAQFDGVYAAHSPAMVALANQDQKMRENHTRRRDQSNGSVNWIIVKLTKPLCTKAIASQRDLLGLDGQVLRICDNCDALMRLPTDRIAEAACHACGTVRLHKT